MNSESLIPCHICGDPTNGMWSEMRGGTRRAVHVCAECIEELSGDAIDDYGDEFPDEQHDDLLPDDFNE